MFKKIVKKAAVVIIVLVLLFPGFFIGNEGELLSITVLASSYYTVTGTTNYLALRSAPGYDGGNEIGKLYNGESVEYLNSGNGSYWYVYSVKLGMSGYVNKKYLAASNSSSASAPSSSGTYRVSGTTNYLALRSAATYDGRNEIGKLYNGDTVELQSKSGSYWYVYSSKLGKYGYVNSKYLTAASGGGSNSQPQIWPIPGALYMVMGTQYYLALRSSASYNSNNEIGRLYNGDTVEIRDSSGKYWYVYSPALGKSGYVNPKYLVSLGNE